MKRSFSRRLGLILAGAVLLTALDTPVYASLINEEVSSGDILLESEAALSGEELSEEGLPEEELIEEELLQEDEGALDDEGSSESVFGFYETRINAKEGDDLTISIVREGTTVSAASVVFKAVDVSARYGEDYTLAIERKILPDKTLKPSGASPLLEEYVEVSVSADQLSENRNAGISSELTNEGTKETGEETALKETVLTGTESPLASIYSIQTGSEAPAYNWREFSKDKPAEENEEITSVMQSGFDSSMEGLQSLPGVTVRLDFAPGEDKKEIKVKIKDDDRSESDEVMVYVLEDAKGARIGDACDGYLNIADTDESEAITFSIKERALNVSPDQDLVRVTVVRTGGIDRMGFVTVGTKGIDAVADEDYVKTYKELFFAAGVTEKTIEIPIIGKRERESRFYVGIKGAGDTVSSNNACYVTIERASGEEADIIINDTALSDIVPDGSGTQQATTEAAVYDLGTSVPSDKLYYDTDFHKVKDGIDLRGVNYVKIFGRVRTKTYFIPKTCHLKLVDLTSGKTIGTATCSSADGDSGYSFTAQINRSEKETWNYSNACVYAKLGTDTFNAVKNAYATVNKISLGYQAYGLKMGSGGEYAEKIYTEEAKYGSGKQVEYPKSCFADGSGGHSYQINAYPGLTVTTSVWEGGGENSQGVKADNTTLKFKGYKLLKPGTQNSLSGFICTGDSFTFNRDFPVKYRDYMSSDYSFTLVPFYEPLQETVEFDNSNASVDGKDDVKGVYDGFRSGYKLKATMLDTIRVSTKVNDGYKISHIEVQKPNGAMYYINRPDVKWTRWATMSDNTSAEDKTTIASPINFNGQMYTNEEKTRWSHQNYCRVLVCYDTSTSSITLAPSPQQIKTGTENCKVVYIKGSGGSKVLLKPVKAGETIELSDTLVRSPYTFGAMPTEGYHAYWKDGTLDSNGDGTDDLVLPGYEPFIPTFGDQFMFIQNVPLKNKIYYNFVKNTASEDVDPLPLSGYLKLSDRLLLSGREVKRGLDGITVFSNGQSTKTKGSDGLFELVSNNKFQFYDLYNYNISFSGKDGDDTIALMVSRNPGRTGDIVIDAAGDVDISDVKLYKKGTGDYAAINTSAAADGYIRLPAGNADYRLKMSAKRKGEELTNGTLTFYNTDGTVVPVPGTEDASHNGTFTFDFNPKKAGVKVGATAKVKYYAGSRDFLSRDVGLKMGDDVGNFTVKNFLSGHMAGIDASGTSDILPDGNPDNIEDKLRSYKHTLDMGWTGDFDESSGEDIYEDGSKRVIRAGFDRDIISLSGEKNAITEAARESALADEAVGNVRERIAGLKTGLINAGQKERDALEKEIDKAAEELEEKEKLADKARKKLDKMLGDVQNPEKATVTFGEDLPMELGYSFLMTFGFDSGEGRWYFEDMILTSTLKGSSSATVNYQTPIGAAVGVGIILKAGGSATFVVEDKSADRYYITEDNRDDFHILDAAADGSVNGLESHGRLSMNPDITLTSSSGLAGELIRVDVSGRALLDMVYGGSAISAGSCAISASIDVTSLNLTTSKELANGIYSLHDGEAGDGTLDQDLFADALSGDGNSLLYDSIDTLRAEDLSYLKGDTEWYAGEDLMLNVNAVSAGSDAAYESPESGYRQRRLAGRIAPNSDFHVAPLGDGRFGCVFLNAPSDRLNDKNNALAAYYTCYDNGSFSEPLLLEDDKTLDQYPRIYPVKDRGALILWSSVNKDYKDTEDKLIRHNSLDLHGRFVKTDGTLDEDIMEITRTTTDEDGGNTGLIISDFAAERAFGAAVDTDKLMVAYEKREYSSQDQNAAVGDMLYPVRSMIAFRTFDLTENKWLDGDEDLAGLPGLSALDEETAGERLETYNANVYGQKFYDYLPMVMLYEDLDETLSYYRESGSTPSAVPLEDPENVMLLESDAATYTDGGDRRAVFAFTVDTDGDLNTVCDRELYLSTGDFDGNSFSEPIILTGYSINSETGESVRYENRSPRFTDTEEGLYLTWLRNGDIVSLNVSALLKNEDTLVKTGEVKGVGYRYVDKTLYEEERSDEYEAPVLLVKGNRAEEITGTDNEPLGNIESFDVETDGRNIYVIWPEDADDKPEDLNDGLNDIQMWGVRAGVNESRLKDVTLPVQITGSYGVKYDDPAFCVINGRIIGIAREVPSRLITASEAKEIFADTYDESCFVPYAKWDETGSFPIAFTVDPGAIAGIKNAGFLRVHAGEDAAFSLEVFNKGFDDLNNARVTATDRDGNILLDETVNDLRGGDSRILTGSLPLAEDALEAEVAITLTENDDNEKRLTIKEELRPDICLKDMAIETTGVRNLYHITGRVSNEGDTKAPDGSISLTAGADDLKRDLRSIEYPELLAGGSYDIDELVEVTDKDFTKISDTSEELRLFAEYISGTGRHTAPVYLHEYHHDADTERGFITRSVDPYGLESLSYVTGVSVNAVKGIYSESGELTGGKIVSSGKGELTLELSETVDIQVAILTDSPRKGALTVVDSEGSIIDAATGTEGLTLRYEFQGDMAGLNADGTLTALKEGTGKLKVYVYPADGGYSGLNAPDSKVEIPEEDVSFRTDRDGYVPDSFHEYPSFAIKTFVLDVNITGEGKRAENAYFTANDGIRYHILNDSEAAVCDYNEEMSPVKLNIPATVKIDGHKYKVTRIEANAFANCGTLLRVTSGKNVTRIGAGAFESCSKLDRADLPSGLTVISDNAFKNCTALKTITLPRKLQSIGDETFLGCISIGAVTLPEGLEYLGDRAFYGCSGLKKITIRSRKLTEDAIGDDVFTGTAKDAVYKLSISNSALREELSDVLTKEGESFSDSKGLIYRVSSKDGKTLAITGLTDAAKVKLKSVSIPVYVTHKGYKYTVTGIEEGAFKDNIRLTKVTLCKTLKYIGESAFNGCSALKSIVIPQDLVSIGDYAFSGCVNLKKITLKSDGLTLGEGVFDKVPDTAVFKYSFKGDEAKNKLMTQLLTGIEQFTDKKGLIYEILDPDADFVLLTGTAAPGITALTIPDTVEFRGAKLRPITVEDSAFAYVHTLKKVTLGKNIKEVGPNAFAGCDSLVSVNLKSVTLISFGAFKGCTSLKTLKLPGTLTEIENSAFAGCTSLKSITIRSDSLSYIGYGAFEGIHPNATFKITGKGDKEYIRKLL